jgi:tetratricopeptide (TPR) repeat protein
MTHTLATLGRAEEARPPVARALALAEELNDAGRIADAWAATGQVEGMLGNASLALERFADAAELYEKQGRAGEAAWMETATASILVALGRPDLALARFEAAAELHEHLEDLGSLSEDLAAVAGLLVEAGRLDDALGPARRAVEKAMEVDDRFREVDARVRLAQVQGRKGDWPDAASTLDEAVGLIRQVARDDPAKQVGLLLTAALTDHNARLDDRARKRLEAARKLADESGSAELKQAVVDIRAEVEAGEPTPAAPKPQP